jgi:hypothetical protein
VWCNHGLGLYLSFHLVPNDTIKVVLQVIINDLSDCCFVFWVGGGVWGLLKFSWFGLSYVLNTILDVVEIDSLQLGQSFFMVLNHPLQCFDCVILWGLNLV